MGIWIFFNLNFGLDFGLAKYGVGIHRANILETIDRFGSVSAAAPAVNLTFSQMWRTVRILNSHCDQPMVATRTRRPGRGGFPDAAGEGCVGSLSRD